jgi:hypothetical protein
VRGGDNKNVPGFSRFHPICWGGLQIASLSCMGLSHIAIIAAISLGGLVPSSCSKTPAPPQRARAAGTNVAATQSKTRDLGVIQLTNRYETEIDLGKGESCTITPRLLGRRDLQLTLSFGSKNADGRPTGLYVTQVVTQPDKPFDITVNDIDLAFTPRLAE